MNLKIKKFKEIIAQEHFHWWQYKNKSIQWLILATNFKNKFKDQKTRFIYRWIRFQFDPDLYYSMNTYRSLCGKLYFLIKDNQKSISEQLTNLSLNRKRKACVSDLLSIKKLKIF